MKTPQSKSTKLDELLNKDGITELAPYKIPGTNEWGQVIRLKASFKAELKTYVESKVLEGRRDEVKKAIAVSEEELYHGRAMAEENDDGSLNYGVEAKYFEKRLTELEADPNQIKGR